MKLFSALLLTALLLSGCGAPAPAEPPEDVPPVTEDVIPEESAPAEPAPEAPGRPEEGELVCFQEGEEVHIPAALRTGEGWSLYLPREEWVQEEAQLGDLPAVRFFPEINPYIALDILRLDTPDPAQAREEITALFPDYDLIEDRQGGLGGQLPADNFCGDLLNARLFPAGESTLVLISRYPIEAGEGFGVILAAAADTLIPEP